MCVHINSVPLFAIVATGLSGMADSRTVMVLVMPITIYTLDPDGRRQKKERDGDRKRADVHLSCIIVLNASTSVLVLETM